MSTNAPRACVFACDTIKCPLRIHLERHADERLVGRTGGEGLVLEPAEISGNADPQRAVAWNKRAIATALPSGAGVMPTAPWWISGTTPG